jgi:hypothetical protein
MSEYPVFAVAPVKDGQLFLSQAQKKTINTYLKKKEGQYVRIAFSQPIKERSKAQNRYIWGVVYEMIAAETGYTTEEVHEHMKSMFLPRKFIEIGGVMQQITKSTTTLSTLEFNEYIDKVIAFAAQELSMSIPAPHEGQGEISSQS